MSFEVVPLVIPRSVDSPDAADFLAMTAVRNAIEAEVFGTDDLDVSAVDLLPRWQDPYRPQEAWIAKVDGLAVGRGFIGLDSEDGAEHAWVQVQVLREFRRRGIGAALFDAVLASAARNGRSVLQGDFLFRDAPGPRITPPTGYGSVPTDSPAARFVLSRGFTLEQVLRSSRLELPIDADSLLADTLDAVGDDYRVHTWQGRTPDNWLNDVALLHARMSTDAPSAGLDQLEEQWDAARVRTLDDLRTASSRIVLVAAAEHVASGTLAAFSELNVPVVTSASVTQEDTLVLREHRGRRLGMLVKAANLAVLQEAYPGHPAVTTFNAEENAHMLAVNVALGFVPFVYEAAWRKAL